MTQATGERTSERRQHVAFCGLGRMGAPMAVRVAEAGFRLNVWNRSRAAVEEVASSTHATAAGTPAQAARGADVVVTMLTDGPTVLAVLAGADGVLAGLESGAVVVDCSTTGAEYARQAAQLCEQAGVAFVDCPVSGSTAVAAAGGLGLMAGGEAEVIERVRPVLEAFGKTVVHVGPTGAGAAAKIAVNGLLHTFSTALAEAMVAAEAEGVSRSGLFDVLAAGVLWNTFLGYKREAFTDPENAPVAFDLATATKDLGLAVAASEHAGLPVSLIGRTHELHRAAVDAGYGDKDMAAMAAWFAQQLSRAGAAEQSGSAGHTLERN